MQLKQKLINKQLTIGSWITLGNTGIAEILANAGFDWLVIDLEHTTISLEQAGELIRTIELAGVPSLVRLTSNDENQIKRVMDAGAQGIVVPMVNNANDARKAVLSTRYPPLGVRGVGLARAQQYGASFNENFTWQADMNSGPVVVVQIESIDAVENLKDILAVRGVDSFIIGPYDLSCSMGIPGKFDHPEFKKIMSKIMKISAKQESVSGLHVVEPDAKQLADAIDSGHKFIAYSVDIRMIDVVAREGISTFKRIK
jgi:2-keto-3-deoxy-L-rhamnonate aldolase RhmA